MSEPVVVAPEQRRAVHLALGGGPALESPAPTHAAPQPAIRPVVVLALLGAVLPLEWWVTVLFAPQMGASLGATASTAGSVASLALVMAPVAMLAVASLGTAGRGTDGQAAEPAAGRASRRTWILSSALASAALTALLAVLPPMGGASVLVTDLLLVGAVMAAAAGTAAQIPLLVDRCPPGGRITALAVYGAGQAGAAAVAAGLYGLCAAAHLTWRVAFLLTAVGTLAAVAAGRHLSDPGWAAHEEEALRSGLGLKGPAGGGESEAGTAGGVEAGGGRVRLGEVMTRVLLFRTMAPLLSGMLLAGMALAAWAVYVPELLSQGWGLPAGDRLVWQALTGLVAAAGLVGAGWWLGPRLFSHPERSLRAVAGFLGACGFALLAGGLTTVLSVAEVELTLGVAGAVLVAPVLWSVALRLVPPQASSHAAALVVASGFSGGFVVGRMTLGAIDSRFGPSWALALLGALVAAGGLSVRRAAASVEEDVTAGVDLLIEDRVVGPGGRSGRSGLLVCRHVDFSYGQLQVLFDVNFTIDEGEMVALLGTNGAGKSTLLRVISGLGIPERGSVRLNGKDITYLSAERRVAEGIIQVPGGRATFGPLSVLDNLRMHGYSLGRQRRRVEEAIEEVFEAFPQLAARREQPAGTLSGGEQQMLALGKALILQPRVLLIDELSLGLAPRIVGELLDMVRRINQAGTAIVLVEQSVNIALSLVHHAYFMEKGEIRFDGRAADLLARDDLLRSVFLGGADSAPADRDGLNGKSRNGTGGHTTGRNATSRNATSRNATSRNATGLNAATRNGTSRNGTARTRSKEKGIGNARRP